MNVLLWHVHGSWATAFVAGRHRYFVPVLPDRGPDGMGRPQRPGTFDWPDSVVEVTPESIPDLPIEVAVLQRPHEEALLDRWSRGRPVAKVYVEHNTPHEQVGSMRHPAADRPDLLVVHVTHFNDLFWDCGSTPTTVVEHGIVDPGYRYRGTRPAAAVVVNDPVRRGRVTGTDLLDAFRQAAPIDLFGMRSEGLGGLDLPQTELHEAMATRRVYLHTARWTSLGLSLLEAMHLGMPVVAVGSTEAWEAVPDGAGVVSTSVVRLQRALRDLLADPEAAGQMGRCARAAALRRYGLARFLADWDRVLASVAA